MTTKKTKTKVRKKIADNIYLMLDGSVYIIECDSRDKIISKAEIDGDSVLKALAHLLSKSTKTRKKP